MQSSPWGFIGMGVYPHATPAQLLSSVSDPVLTGRVHFYAFHTLTEDLLDLHSLFVSFLVSVTWNLIPYVVAFL